VLNNLAENAMIRGDCSSARQVIAQGIALSRAAATYDVLTTLLSNVAQIELDQGNAVAARAACGEAIRMQIRMGLLNHISGTLVESVAVCACAQEEMETAAFLYGAAHAVSDHAGIDVSEWFETYEARVREGMSDSVFNTAFSQGSALSSREALNVALTWLDENAPQDG
jgi:hypothetical protein